MKLVIMLALAVSVGCAEDNPKGNDQQIDIARLQVKRFAAEAFPMWSMRNPSAACPASLADLVQYAGRPTDTIDPWGQPLTLLCGPTLPAGARGAAVVSAGPDGKPDTADDIKSWE